MEVFTAWVVYIHFVQIISFKKHEKVCNNHDYCYVQMPREYNKTLKYNH